MTRLGERRTVSAGNANARAVLVAAHSDGSWLNLAESELSVLSSQSLDERISYKQTLADDIATWQASRNTAHVKAN